MERFGERIDGMLRLFLLGVDESNDIGLLPEVRVEELEDERGKDEERSMRSVPSE